MDEISGSDVDEHHVDCPGNNNRYSSCIPTAVVVGVEPLSERDVVRFIRVLCFPFTWSTKYGMPWNDERLHRSCHQLTAVLASGIEKQHKADRLSCHLSIRPRLRQLPYRRRSGPRVAPRIEHA